MQKRHIHRGGFALPTVLIASVVMLTILAVSVSSVAAVRTTLKTQYYEQLAKAAGEAGVAFAKACLSKNGNVPLWTDSKPLRPSTDCAGNDTFANDPFRVLIVAGGGSGGGGTGGGGGGGGVITEDYFPLSTGSYPIVVGAGGAASGNQAIGKNGANSSFNGQVAIGGGGGGFTASSTAQAGGLNGGSGGGGQQYYGAHGPGAGTLGQGFAGGPLAGAGAGSTTGGGGAGGPGLNTSVASGGGNGGPGKMSTITGAVEFYGGGGGGGGAGGTCGGATGGIGGVGGGARAGESGVAGLPNTGGGGSGAWCHATGNGGAGGSGIVVISYPKNGSVTATGGTQVYDTGSTRVHIFKSNGTFTVSSVTASTCPTDPRCSVVVDDNLRSSFSVAKPTVDSAGRALTIPNSGYVELLRTTTGEVWRTYRQPNVQAAAVPDLCSGAAASGLGWQNAVLSSSQEKLASAPTAQTVTLVDGNLSAGKMYFRKDFTVLEAGAYNLAVLNTSAADTAQVYLDGASVTVSQGSLVNAPLNLSVGCHTVTVELTNRTLTPKASRFTAAIQKENSTPIVETGTSWRVSSGSSVHFSQTDYYADPSIWGSVVDYSTAGAAQSASSAWQSTQSDIFTRMISPAGNGCAAACPAVSSGYMRDDENFYVSTPTEVQVSTLCDDDCTVFLDGEMVIANSPWSAINQQTMTITPGSHRLAVRIYNSPAAVGPSGAAVSVVDKTTGTVLARTDRSWQASNVWTSGLNVTTEDIRSYEESFRPSPDEIPRPDTYDVLVVAGGGGGGGNCATCAGAGGGGGGGVIFQENVVATTGSRTVTVGAGGTGGAGGAARTNGGNGGNSAFGGVVATGGGGGGAQLGINGSNGGSGGGGSGGGSPAAGGGGTGIAGQGFAGGAGISDPFSGGGGGGAGGAGVNGVGQAAGNGGAGLLTYITGYRITVGSGGGGAAYASNFAGASDVGAGNGVNQDINTGIGYPGVTNTAAAGGRAGGGGGGGNGLSRGGAGGAGGAGNVIVRVRTGSVTVTTTGSPVVANTTINGVAYTVYRFNANGTFNITAL